MKRANLIPQPTSMLSMQNDSNFINLRSGGGGVAQHPCLGACAGQHTADLRAAMEWADLIFFTITPGALYKNILICHYLIYAPL